MTEKRNIAQNLAEDEVLQWVTFQLENETYGINVMQVQEVLRYTEIAPVPGAPDYVLYDFTATVFDGKGQVKQTPVCKQAWQAPHNDTIYLQ